MNSMQNVFFGTDCNWLSLKTWATAGIKLPVVNFFGFHTGLKHDVANQINEVLVWKGGSECCGNDDVIGLLMDIVFKSSSDFDMGFKGLRQLRSENAASYDELIRYKVNTPNSERIPELRKE